MVASVQLPREDCTLERIECSGDVKDQGWGGSDVAFMAVRLAGAQLRRRSRGDGELKAFAHVGEPAVHARQKRGAKWTRSELQLKLREQAQQSGSSAKDQKDFGINLAVA